MRCPIEQPDPAALREGESHLLVGGLWGSVAPVESTPWMEWAADQADHHHLDPTVVLGRD
ncbi:MAG TPA: hypothetical protein VGD67_17530 [Pseudonocardiaceae bacterium]